MKNYPYFSVFLFNTGSIEEKIYQRQISKQDLSGAVVDLSKTSEHTHFSVEELKNLFTLHEDSSCVTHDLLECDCMGKIDHQSEFVFHYLWPLLRNPFLIYSLWRELCCSVKED